MSIGGVAFVFLGFGFIGLLTIKRADGLDVVLVVDLRSLIFLTVGEIGSGMGILGASVTFVSVLLLLSFRAVSRTSLLGVALESGS